MLPTKHDASLAASLRSSAAGTDSSSQNTLYNSETIIRTCSQPENITAQGSDDFPGGTGAASQIA
jgi:hypothetical protein